MRRPLFFIWPAAGRRLNAAGSYNSLPVFRGIRDNPFPLVNDERVSAARGRETA